MEECWGRRVKGGKGEVGASPIKHNLSEDRITNQRSAHLKRTNPATHGRLNTLKCTTVYIKFLLQKILNRFLKCYL